MKTQTKASTVFWLVAILFWLCPLTAVRADTLKIPGTGACEVLLRAVAQAFNARHPQQRVLVPPSIGTVGGMRLVTSDKAVLVRVARSLTKKEKAQGLTYLPFARDMVIFAVGAKVPVRNITTSRLVEVYAGKIKNWEVLGGPNAPIRLLLRQPGDSSLLIIQKHLKAFRTITFDPSGKIPYTDPEMLALLQKYNYSIGWLTYSALKDAKTPIYPLALDGIAPTPKNALTKKYNLLEEYALVFKKKRLDHLSKIFMDFLFSPAGKRVIESMGTIPLPRK